MSQLTRPSVYNKVAIKLGILQYNPDEPKYNPDEHKYNPDEYLSALSLTWLPIG